MLEKEVKEQDIHDHRTEQRQPECHIASEQQQHPSGDLESCDHLKVPALKHGADERPGRSRRRSPWDEVQETVQSEDDEHEPEQDPGNDDCDFHG
jgi:hypothetical protein